MLFRSKDIISNIKKKDKIITEAIRNGFVLWGYDKLVRIIKDVNQKKD